LENGRIIKRRFRIMEDLEAVVKEIKEKQDILL
jgi:hypothetical protein